MKAPLYLEYNSQLRAVPSIHGRVMFSVLVRRMCVEYKPDVIAVEMPPSLGEAACELWKSLDGDYRGYPPLLMLAQIRKPRSQHSLPLAFVIPIGPGDSLVEAVRCGVEHSIPLSFIDSEYLPGETWERPRMKSVEDGLLLHEGLAVFYNKIRDDVLKTRVEDVDLPREMHMARQLKLLLDQGKKILLVSGAAHWESICSLLEEPQKLDDIDALIPKQEVVDTMVLHASTLTFSAHSSDLPAVILKYESMRRRKKAQNFSHEKAWHSIWRRVLNRLGRIEGSASTRDLINFFEYLYRLCLHTGYLHPSFLHLVYASKSCGSETFSQIILAEALRYPTANPKSSLLPLPLGQLDNIQLSGPRLTAEIDGQRAAIASRQNLRVIRFVDIEKRNYKPEPPGPAGGGPDWKKVRDLLSNPDKQLLRELIEKALLETVPERDRWKVPEGIRDEYSSLMQGFIQSINDLVYSERCGITMWSTDESTAHLNKMCLEARNLASVKLENECSLEAKDVYRGVPDIPRIIKSRIRLDDRIYVKATQPSRLSSNNIFEGFDPMLWIFSALDEDREGISDSTAPDGETCYIVNIMYGEKVPMDSKEMVRARLSAIALFTPDYLVKESSRLRRWIRSGNQKHVPKLAPQTGRCEIWDQDALVYKHLTPQERASSFETHEILFLAAVYYARRYVIWISDKTLWPSPLLKRICKRQRKSLICLTLDRFSPSDTEKLRNYEYNIPPEFIDWAVDEVYKALKSSDFLSALDSYMSKS